VTLDCCNIDNCDGVHVHPNGQHGFHAKARTIKRHNKVRDALGHVFQKLHRSGYCDYTVNFETFLSVLGIPQKPNAPDKSDAKADFYLHNPATNRVIITDVMVTHPGFDKKENHTVPLHAASEGAKLKYKRYLENYEIDKADVIPLVFDSYGGYADASFKFLAKMANTIGANDPQLAASVLRSLRDRVAVALYSGQVELINWLNTFNKPRHAMH
jgi:hypothetical protein